jgi:hypothetical protein
LAKRIIGAGVAAFLFLAAASAQAAPDPRRSGAVLGVPAEQAAVVVAGILAGAALVEALLPSRLAYIGGGVLGGLIANWWYETGGEGKLRPLVKPAIADVVARPVAAEPR